MCVLGPETQKQDFLLEWKCSVSQVKYVLNKACALLFSKNELNQSCCNF
jgi:hypothetical protein